MGRSFGIVEQKVEESAYFLNLLEESINDGRLLDGSQFLLSAFLSATRSITFTIQASISDIEGFKEWYSQHQQRLKATNLAKYFLEARNLSQKIGYYLIAGGYYSTDEKGNRKMLCYFQRLNSIDMDYVPTEDVITGCKLYFKLLLEVVLDCYKRFGNQIDPEQFFTYRNLIASGKTIEEFEEQAGFPRGYTAVPDLSIEERIMVLNRYSAKPSRVFELIMIDYLGVNRFGETVI